MNIFTVQRFESGGVVHLIRWPFLAAICGQKKHPLEVVDNISDTAMECIVCEDLKPKS